MSLKKNAVRVTILNEEYSIRSDAPPEHTKAVAHYLDQGIRKVLASGVVIETNRAVVFAALQITAELFNARQELQATTAAVQSLSEYVRPLLPPAKRHSTVP
jgi:cell division protein ZapA